MEIWVAPMMGYTHGWFRAMIQAIHPQVRVMTEMVTLHTLKHCPNHPSLWQHPLESDPALQIAASSPELVKELRERLAGLPFTHINLNAGCPSAQVGSGCMGAAMLYHPEVTRDVLSALAETGKVVSIKTRLGVDEQDDQQWDQWFEVVKDSGVKEIFLHARQALTRLNPAQNRSIPPLRYDRASEIASKHKDHKWILNGGLRSIESIEPYRNTSEFKGVMLGRLCYQDPMSFWQLAKTDGVADFTRIDRWFESFEGKLCSSRVTALLALSKGLRNASELRESITKSKGTDFDARKLRDLLFEKYQLAA